MVAVWYSRPQSTNQYHGLPSPGSTGSEVDVAIAKCHILDVCQSSQNDAAHAGTEQNKLAQIKSTLQKWFACSSSVLEPNTEVPNRDSVARRNRFRSWLCLSITMKPGADVLNSPCLSFSMCYTRTQSLLVV